MPETVEPDVRPLTTTTAETFPVTHSLLSPNALGRHIQAAYAIGAVRSCVLLQHNLNDTYVVDAVAGRYVLRVSQAERATGGTSASWRSHEDLLFEVEVLQYLSRKGVPVATPVVRRDGISV